MRLFIFKFHNFQFRHLYLKLLFVKPTKLLVASNCSFQINIRTYCQITSWSWAEGGQEGGRKLVSSSEEYPPRLPRPTMASLSLSSLIRCLRVGPEWRQVDICHQWHWLTLQPEHSKMRIWLFEATKPTSTCPVLSNCSELWKSQQLCIIFWFAIADKEGHSFFSIFFSLLFLFNFHFIVYTAFWVF